MSAAAPAHATGSLAWRIFVLFAAGYFMSYGLRSVNAVLAPELVAEIGLSNAQLGSLSSAYFFTFAAMQLPLGIWLDRYGPRRIDAALMTLAAAGCAMFAIAHSFGALWIGRALVGVGVSAALMAALTAFRQWFPPERQAQMNAWMLTVGTMGVLTSTVPVRWALPAVGWRGIFWIAAAVLCAVAIAMWTLLPRTRERQADGAPGFLAGFGGYAEVFRNRFFWRMAVSGAVVQSGFVALQSLWVGPWLTRVLGLSPEQSASRLFLFNLGLMVCYLVVGWLAPRFDPGRNALPRVVIWSTSVLITAELAIAWARGEAAWLLWLVTGAAAALYSQVQPRVGLVFPSRLAGRALTAFNLVLFVGVFLTQWGFGVVVDAYRAGGLAEEPAFRATMLSLAALHAAVLALFIAWPRLWPEPAAGTP